MKYSIKTAPKHCLSSRNHNPYEQALSPGRSRNIHSKDFLLVSSEYRAGGKVQFEQLKTKIRGPIFSVVTPFLENDEIDYSSLERYLQNAYDKGARNFYVMGYNSRFSQLDFQEIKELNRFVTQTVKAIDPNTLIIVADPLHCSTRISVDFTNHANKIGADLISLIVREKYYSNQQIIAHFDEVIKQTQFPILIHEMPFLSGFNGSNMDWPITLVEELVCRPEIIAMKEDSKTDALTLEVVKNFKDKIRIVVSGGGKKRWLKFRDAGCDSWLNGIGVFAPEVAVHFWQAVQAQDEVKIEKIINEIETPFFDKCVSPYGWHLACKAALQAKGFMNRFERLPMLALDDKNYKVVEQVVTNLPIEKVLYG